LAFINFSLMAMERMEGMTVVKWWKMLPSYSLWSQKNAEYG
jgi:hypothetical protein